MNNIAIKIEGLSKLYKIGSGKSGSVREAFADFFNTSYKEKEKSEFWALKEVSFEIMKGEAVGIIGKNGAGKSTLLKILSRITEPSNGRIEINGRVSSLLEVGTGFHPELTGKENIFLNGTILGMTRKEVKAKFDEIVNFSGVEKFINTPVKHYSSGMYVRLAFAVAAHLEPEILIIDEVLAVGDAEFQKKCLGKMEDVSKNQGRTVLFVSHNMAAVQNLCTFGVEMNQGKVVQVGKINNVINGYLSRISYQNNIPLKERRDRVGAGNVQLASFYFINKEGLKISTFYSGQFVKLILILFKKTPSTLNNIHIAIGIDDFLGNRITHLSNDITNQIFNGVTQSDFTIEIEIEKIPLVPGKYSFTFFVSASGEVEDWIQDVGSFYVEQGDFFSSGKLPKEGSGIFYIKHFFRLI